jgi:hypothetical protein
MTMFYLGKSEWGMCLTDTHVVSCSPGCRARLVPWAAVSQLNCHRYIQNLPAPVNKYKVCAFRWLTDVIQNGMKIIHDTEKTKCTMLYLRYLNYIVTLSIYYYFNPQRIFIRETGVNYYYIQIYVYMKPYLCLCSIIWYLFPWRWSFVDWNM